MEPLEQEMSPCPQPSQRDEGATIPSSKRQSRSRVLSQFSEHSLHAPQPPHMAVEFHPGSIGNQGFCQGSPYLRLSYKAQHRLQLPCSPQSRFAPSPTIKSRNFKFSLKIHLSKFRVDRVLPSIPSTAQSPTRDSSHDVASVHLNCERAAVFHLKDESNSSQIMKRHANDVFAELYRANFCSGSSSSADHVLCREVLVVRVHSLGTYVVFHQWHHRGFSPG